MIYKSSKQLTLLVTLWLGFAFPLSADEETPLVCDESPATVICGDGFLALSEGCENSFQCSTGDACSSNCECVSSLALVQLPGLGDTGALLLAMALLGAALFVRGRSQSFVAPLVLVMLAASPTRGAVVVELGDCEKAACGIPSDAEATATCSGSGNCSTGNYTWATPPNPAIQRCTASYAVNDEPAGPWNADGQYASQQIDNCGTYAGNCESISIGIQLGETKNDTASVSFSVELSKSVKAELSNAMVGTVGTEVSAAFTAGETDESSEMQSTTITGTLTGVPCCGKKVAKFTIWKRNEPSTADASFILEGQCTNNGVSCDGGIWHQMKMCDASSALTSVNREPSASLKTCDQTCSSGDLHECCTESATTSPASCVPGIPS